MSSTLRKAPPRRVFLDTNVFVYVFDASAPRKQARARDFVKQCLSQGNGVIGHQVVQEFANVALHRMQRPMTADECTRTIRELLLPMFAIFKRSFDAAARPNCCRRVHRGRDAGRPRASRPRCWRASLTSTRTSAPRPTWHWHPPAQAPGGPAAAPGGGGLWPLRHLCGAGAGADGLSAHRAGARQAGARAHQGHLGPVAQERAATREQCAVWRRRRRHLQ
jgi:hypothetical protein